MPERDEGPKIVSLFDIIRKVADDKAEEANDYEQRGLLGLAKGAYEEALKLYKLARSILSPSDFEDEE